MKLRLTKIDWLSYTDRVNSLQTIIDLWQPIFGDFITGEGRIGYRDGLRAHGITILFNPSHDEDRMGVHIDITGQGCDMLYSSGFDIFEFVTQVLISSDAYCISRLDVAHDYFADSEVDFFPYDDMVQAFNELRFITPVQRKPTSIYSHHSPVAGESCSRDTLYFGSAKSPKRLTIYNKLAEKNDKGLAKPYIDIFKGEIKQWIRFEFRLRDQLADVFALALRSYELQPTDSFIAATACLDSLEYKDVCEQCVLSIVFISLLSKFVRFCFVVKDHSSRSPVISWWSEFVDIGSLFESFVHLFKWRQYTH